MYTDEIYEDLLITKKTPVTKAHMSVIKEKLTKDSSLVDVLRVENGYQLFRRRHPDYPEDSFRRHCYVSWSRGGQFPGKAREAFIKLGWSLKPEYSSIGR